MKFSEDVDSKHRLITAYGNDFITVDEQRYHHPLVLTETQPPQRWAPSDIATLAADDLDVLLVDTPDIVIIGTGMRQQFLPPALLHHIMQHGIGCEVMNTPSACRTWNIVVAEGRRVAAGLIVGER